MTQAASSRTLEAVDVECTHCGVRMTSSVGGGGTIRYYRCPSCARWSSSMYEEIYRADSKMRTRPAQPQQATGFGTARERIDAWLRSIAVNDPYRVLGATPDDTDLQLRERYLALARQHHPDRGGDVAQMGRVNEAYERVLAQRAQQRRFHRPVALGAGH